MDESELLFNLFYFLICMCILYPPEEFTRLGFSIEQIFAGYLGNEKLNFVLYHQRRICLNIFVHSCLPATYFLIHQLKFSALMEGTDAEDSDLDPDFPMPQEAVFFKTLAWRMAQRFSLMAVLAVPALIYNWNQQNWRRHPITQTLLKYSTVPENYEIVASNISNEFRGFDIYQKKLNSISTLIATENWIIKTGLYNVHFAHQGNADLTVDKTETYNVSQTNDTLQMVSILVKPNQAGVADFKIRINALEFRNLQERVNPRINIPSGIRFHRNVVDRFIAVFKDQVARNPVYIADASGDKCFACMMEEPNIKINKMCEDVDQEGRPLTADASCTNCNCRPMWCVECLARWFASRQSENAREIWLQQKCTCPMCRAKFCLLDVSYIVSESGRNTSNT